ncbi:MAG: hypothetical protein NWE89_10565 [Candidatus Bathyarchaeota archaeon]|nr:hypothetical protein [Candidatus Bathyarchaeota archaeon]
MTKTSNPTRGLSVTGKTREAVAAFLKNMQERRFSDAERALKEVKNKKFTNEEYKAGYVNALDGLLLSVRSGDERDFCNKVAFTSENSKNYRAEFKEFSAKPIRTSFDRGYFAAWQDLMQYKYNLEK